MNRNLIVLLPRHSVLIVVCLIFCVCLGRSGVRAEVRTYDGSGNNLLHATWGAAGTQLARKAPAAYDDGFAAPRDSIGGLLPNPRLVSNTAIAQTVMFPNTHQMTDWVFQWGQFVDHFGFRGTPLRFKVKKSE